MQIARCHQGVMGLNQNVGETRVSFFLHSRALYLATSIPSAKVSKFDLQLSPDHNMALSMPAACCLS